MPQQNRLETGAPWVELTTTEDDWKAADPALLGTMLAELNLIRAFEETVLELAGEGLVHGPAHSSVGQEGGAVGSIVGLRSTDAVNGSHRGHHQFLAKALTHVSGSYIDPAAPITPKIARVLQQTLAEILGLAQGYCRGRGGSMHLQWFEAGALGTNAIVGGGVPMGAGNAWAQKHSGTADVTISYFGDGSSQIGSVLETMNLAAAWKLPFCFFIENNLYAVSTRVDEITADPRLSVRGQGFGIPGWRVDGMDPLAVYLATQQAAEQMRSGGGPAVIEAEVYRFFHQNGSYPGSAFGYRDKAEEAQWRTRDPLDKMASQMIALGHIDDDGVATLRRLAQDAMNAAVAELLEDNPEAVGKRRIRPELWPDPGFVNVGVRGDASELASSTVLEPITYKGPWRKTKFVEAVAGVMDRRMETDQRIVIFGEDVHRLNGGTNGATKGLAKYGENRLVGTPISENAFTGLGGGLALDGRFRPVVEFMYPDFMWVAADQVFNQIGKARHMFGGQNPVPIVLRTKVAMGSGYGSQHLMDPAGIFATSPGWRIVAPSTAADYVGLMNAALALQDPVLVIEHVDLYGTADQVPDIDLDYIIPPGQAAIRRAGNDVTVISYLSMVGHCAEAIEQTGMDAELIDLRWLDRASIDWDTIEASVKKTNAVLIVEQGARGSSYGGWLADEIQRRLFDWLDQPVERVSGEEASPSISRVLERAAIARTEEVVAGLAKIRVNMGAQLMATVMRMPEVLANTGEAIIQTWLVAVGQEIAVGDPIAEIETEKAVVEYAAEVDGVLSQLLAEPGTTIAVGEPIAVVLAPGETGTDGNPGPLAVTVTRDPESAAPVVEAAASEVPAVTDGRRLFATPLVRKLAKEKGIDLGTVSGTGPGGRIVRRDLEVLPVAAVADKLVAAPPRVPGKPAETTEYTDTPLTGMRKAIARRLTESKTTVPHFYVTADCRVDALLELRKSVNDAGTVKVSVNDFVLKAAAGALVEVPEANSIWNVDSIRRFTGVDIAVAVAIEGGLLTPVLRGVASLPLSSISTQIADLAARARSGKIKQQELEGGSFSVSNLGMYGVKEFSAILNPPHSGILAVGGASQRPVVVDGALAVGTVMTVTLSADHRVIDGALAAQWMAAFVRRIENPLTILI